MTDREPHDGEPEVDDWFAEPERQGRRRRREIERTPETEDWLGDDEDRELGVGIRGLRTEAKVGLAVAALAVILLIGLAAAGVFSSGGKKATPPATTQTTPTTTAQTTPPAKPTFAVPTAPLQPNDTGSQVTRAPARAQRPRLLRRQGGRHLRREDRHRVEGVPEGGRPQGGRHRRHEDAPGPRRPLGDRARPRRRRTRPGRSTRRRRRSSPPTRARRSRSSSGS